MTVSVASVDRRVFDMRLRMPFHFGEATYHELPHLFVEVTLGGEYDGTTGLAAEHVSPLWFLSDPDVGFEAGVDATYEVVDKASEHALEVEGDDAFEYWHRLYDAQRSWADGTDHPPLLWAFGVSLLERAVIDAVCRATGKTFGTAVRENTLGIDLGTVHPELEGTDPVEWLPDEPRRETAIRHTVGATDPLTDDDLEPEQRLDDGLPQTLLEYVESQGISYFKIKLTGDVDRDARRLEDIDAVLGDREYVVTLDANEQYGEPESFKRDWQALTARTDANRLLENLRYVEQPLAREHALTDAAAAVFTDWAEGPSIIIDESDGQLDSLRRALECGYAGTSHKNCKGVFKGIANACYLAYRRREEPDREYVISGEDLSTVGPIGLQQDLAVMATIGKSNVERNGHHYFRGMGMLPETLQEALLDAHGDLYRRHEDGFPTLAIEDGRISLDSVVEAPFGRALNLDVTAFNRE